jgi:hypothetical protein
MQHAPLSQAGAAAAPPLAITPAPPLIRRFTAPPHCGQLSTAASDIFCRRSKRWPQAWHWYSYAGMECSSNKNREDGFIIAIAWNGAPSAAIDRGRQRNNDPCGRRSRSAKHLLICHCIVEQICMHSDLLSPCDAPLQGISRSKWRKLLIIFPPARRFFLDIVAA